MAYIRKKKIKRSAKKASRFYKDNPDEYTYYQLVEGYRDSEAGGKVKQRVLAHLGHYRTLEEALEALPASLERRRRVVGRYPKSMQPGMERRIAQDEERLATLQRLRAQGIA